MAVVTISRLFGIGGRAFGRALAERLGYGYVDKELLASIAEKSGSSEEAVALYEEREGPARLVRDFLHRKYPGARPEIMDPARYGEVLRAVIRELAARDRLVIVGRGGQCVLAGHPHTVHLRLIADLEHLVGRLARLPRFAGVPEEELGRTCARHRESRRHFVQRHFGCDPEDPLLYHLVMNLGRLPEEEAVEIAAAMARRREGPGGVAPP